MAPRKSLSFRSWANVPLRATFCVALLFSVSCGFGVDVLGVGAPYDSVPCTLEYSLKREISQKGVVVHVQAVGKYGENSIDFRRNEVSVDIRTGDSEKLFSVELLFISNSTEEWLISKDSLGGNKRVFKFEPGRMKFLSTTNNVDKTQSFGPSDFNPLEIWQQAIAEGAILEGNDTLTLKNISITRTGFKHLHDGDFPKGYFSFTPGEHDIVESGETLLSYE